ncbi:MAG TPA: ATP-binding protein [Nevskiaceae bacterium]|nr:ATP-binding protein [Nevskiaceae bacterium]
MYLRLFGWFLLANLLTLALSVFVANRIAQREWHAYSDWPAMARSAVAHYASGGRRGLWEWAEPLRHSGIIIDLLDAHGESVLRRHSRLPWTEEEPRLLGETEVELHPRPDLTLASVPVQGPHEESWHFIAFRSPPPRGPATVFEHVATEIIVSLLVVGVVGWWVTRTIARPVSALQHAARRMAQGDLSARAGAQAAREPGELGELARDFDHMAARIETLVQGNRSLLQDISHELRSPLARLQIALGLARRDAGAGEAHFDRAEREVSRLDHLIGEVLTLSRMEIDLPGMQTQRVEFSALLRELVEDNGAGEGSVPQVVLAAPQPVHVQGDPELLERAAGNLISNALKYGKADGRVELTLTRSADKAVLTVADDGPGVPADELPRLFEPFFRGSNAARASGSGLGLSIVDRIVRAHGGTVSAENRAGGGLVVTLTLPALES